MQKKSIFLLGAVLLAVSWALYNAFNGGATRETVEQLMIASLLLGFVSVVLLLRVDSFETGMDAIDYVDYVDRKSIGNFLQAVNVGEKNSLTTRIAWEAIEEGLRRIITENKRWDKKVLTTKLLFVAHMIICLGNLATQEDKVLRNMIEMLVLDLDPAK